MRIGISGEGWAYGVLKWIKGAKVRTRNRNVIEMKQGPWKQEWDKGEVKSEFWYGVAQSITCTHLSLCDLSLVLSGKHMSNTN